MLSIGSAIMGPQVFEKSLSCVNNLRLQDGRPIVVAATRSTSSTSRTAAAGTGPRGEPPKTNPAYYLRFCKSYSRMGGAMHYLQCDNATFIHNLYHRLLPGIMTPERFRAITVALLRRCDRRRGRLFPRPLPRDRSRKAETSIETGLPVHNVV